MDLHHFINNREVQDGSTTDVHGWMRMENKEIDCVTTALPPWLMDGDFVRENARCNV
jgi:hypothetical protein